MNLTPLQQRRLELTEKELSQLETAAKKHGTFFWVKITFLFIFFALMAELVLAVVMDKQSFGNFLNSYNWRSFLVSSIVMLLLNVWLFRVSASQIKNKKKELDDLRKKYGMGLETTAP